MSDWAYAPRRMGPVEAKGGNLGTYIGAHINAFNIK